MQETTNAFASKHLGVSRSYLFHLGVYLRLNQGISMIDYTRRSTAEEFLDRGSTPLQSTKISTSLQMCLFLECYQHASESCHLGTGNRKKLYFIYIHICILEKGMATHSSILACRIPWTEEPWGRKESDTTERLSPHFCVYVCIYRHIHIHVICISVLYCAPVQKSFSPTT